MFVFLLSRWPTTVYIVSSVARPGWWLDDTLLSTKISYLWFADPTSTPRNIWTPYLTALFSYNFLKTFIISPPIQCTNLRLRQNYCLPILKPTCVTHWLYFWKPILLSYQYSYLKRLPLLHYMTRFYFFNLRCRI